MIGALCLPIWLFEDGSSVGFLAGNKLTTFFFAPMTNEKRMMSLSQKNIFIKKIFIKNFTNIRWSKIRLRSDHVHGFLLESKSIEYKVPIGLQIQELIPDCATTLRRSLADLDQDCVLFSYAQLSGISVHNCPDISEVSLRSLLVGSLFLPLIKHYGTILLNCLFIRDISVGLDIAYISDHFLISVILISLITF